jgi:hypothetical protein
MAYDCSTTLDRKLVDGTFTYTFLTDRKRDVIYTIRYNAKVKEITTES